MPYEKARKLVKVIRALVGDGRMEMLPTGPIASRNPTEPGLSRDPVAASPAEVDPARAPTEEQETRRRSIGWRGIKCPACGSAEEPDARFCSFCNYNLQTRAPIDEARLRARQEGTAENPLAAVTGGKWVARLLELPRHVLILSAVGIVALVLLVVFGR